MTNTNDRESPIETSHGAPPWIIVLGIVLIIASVLYNPIKDLFDEAMQESKRSEVSKFERNKVPSKPKIVWKKISFAVSSFRWTEKVFPSYTYFKEITSDTCAWMQMTNGSVFRLASGDGGHHVTNISPRLKFKACENGSAIISVTYKK